MKTSNVHFLNFLHYFFSRWAKTDGTWHSWITRLFLFSGSLFFSSWFLWIPFHLAPIWRNVLSITAPFSSISAYCFKVVKAERLTIFAPPVFMWSQTKQIWSAFGSENSVEEHLCLWHWKADFFLILLSFIGLSEPGCCVLILLWASPRTVFFEVCFLYIVVRLYSLFISQCMFLQAPSETALAALWSCTQVFPGSG